MKRILRFVVHLFLFFLFTAVTQIGGVIYIAVVFVCKTSLVKRWLVFMGSYIVLTLFIVPLIAPMFGREKINAAHGVVIHSFFTTLANRNYVIPEMNVLLQEVQKDLRADYPTMELHCLDANFPFFDGVPLLPHLSHNDGKKLDVSLLYRDALGRVTNVKPSRSGYGVFVFPNADEHNQIEKCKALGYWQYDFPKYLTFGRSNEELTFDAIATRKLISSMLKRTEVAKVFIEPHLRSRMNINHPKLRYHGCKAVRHDDHVHLQLR